MKLIDFLNMFYSLGTDLTKLKLWRNGKFLADKDIGDIRFIKPEYMNAKVKSFAVPKRSHALVVILENEEATNTHVLPKDSDYTRLAEALSMYMKMYK